MDDSRYKAVTEDFRRYVECLGCGGRSVYDRAWDLPSEADGSVSSVHHFTGCPVKRGLAVKK